MHLDRIEGRHCEKLTNIATLQSMHAGRKLMTIGSEVVHSCLNSSTD